MVQGRASNRVSTPRRVAQIAGLLAAAALAGCNSDSYLDPSIVGRWERTPTIVPILERIAAIEDESSDAMDYVDPSEADLVPVAKMYRFGPGDRVQITLYDVIEPGRAEEYERSLDIRGMVELPQFGQIALGGLTIEEARAAIAKVVSRLVPDPLVSIVTIAQRQQTFTILGAVQSPGPYFIPSADYRLLDGITAGGTFDNTVPYVYVIRQVQLSAEEQGITTPGTVYPEGSRPGPNIIEQGPGGSRPSTPPPTGQELLDVIDQISKEPPKKPAGSPGMLGQPNESSQPPAARPQANEPPPIPLPDSTSSTRPTAPNAPPPAGTQWVFLNGKWTPITSGEKVASTSTPSERALTQRVIRVPMQGLLAGKREYNVVIRPGDIVRIPPPLRGQFYVGGQIARPGVYSFPDQGRMTLLRALQAGGGLATIAIPERIDLTRMVGPDRQATIMLNGRAIFEQTQPDFFLKPDDIINVGTNFWATPLAVIRNGFRASYGFGFILDRNFAEDVFGVQDSARRF